MKMDLRIVKTLGGLLLGAFATTLVAMPCLYLPDNSGWTLSLPHYDFDGLRVNVVAALMASLFAIGIGLPAHASLYALRLRALVYYLLLAGCGGFALAQTLLGFGSVGLDVALFRTLWAAMCAAIAWLIRRPDRDDTEPVPESHF